LGGKFLIVNDENMVCQSLTVSETHSWVVSV